MTNTGDFISPLKAVKPLRLMALGFRPGEHRLRTRHNLTLNAFASSTSEDLLCNMFYLCLLKLRSVSFVRLELTYLGLGRWWFNAF